MTLLSLLPSFDTRDRIILCEGKTDAQILNEVIQPLTSRIYVPHVGGKDSLAQARAYLGKQGYGSIFIRDCDFSMPPEAASQTFDNQKPETVWTRYDVEGYLLYSDWLHEALQNIRSTAHNDAVRALSLPSQQAIETALLALAEEVALQHAGKSVLADMERRLKKPSIDHPSDRLETLEAWQDHLRQQVERLQNYAWYRPAYETIERSMLKAKEDYSRYAKSLEDVRRHFGCKDLLTLYHGRHLPSDVSVNILREELLKVVGRYVEALKQRGAWLREDERLGDFARLAEKALSDGTNL